jgi:hypothetical protein
VLVVLMPPPQATNNPAIVKRAPSTAAGAKRSACGVPVRRFRSLQKPSSHSINATTTSTEEVDPPDTPGIQGFPPPAGGTNDAAVVVTVSVVVAGLLAVTERVAFAGRQVVPNTSPVQLIEMFPAKLFSEVAVTVYMPDEPAIIVNVGGVTVKLKSVPDPVSATV